MTMLSTMYSPEAIAERVKKIAEQLNKEFEKEDLVHAIITLNGAFVFAADLIRELNFPLVLHFAGSVTMPGQDKPAAGLRINIDALPKNFANKAVILIEDVVDSGDTVKQLREIMAQRFASRIVCASLIRRQGGEAPIDYFGFTVPRGVFIVGYGLDMDGRYRELREIKTLGGATFSGTCGSC